jgi:hypothetical protein
LSDADGDGEWLELPPPDGAGERFADTFRRGTARWSVGRVLADADGDGYTDAFWHLVPSLTERGIRQVVAVRIIDNSAMLNFNAASRFVRADNVSYLRKTRGQTPADLALIGDINDDDYFCDANLTCNLRVGFLDNPEHLEEYLGFVSPLYPPGYDPFGEARVRWSFSRWDDHMAAVGVWDPDVVTDPDAVAELLGPTWERLLYWQASGRRPLDPGLGLTPFNFGDELELRMYHGNNHSKIHTRFEATVLNRVLAGGEDFADNDPGNDWDVLHSDWVERHETSESQEQLRNRELLGDLRSKLTAYNGARNDIMPAWLWWRWQLPTGYVTDTLEANNFLAQSRRKIDLREQPGGPNLYPGERTMVERLPTTLVHVLSQTFPRQVLTDLNQHAHFGDSYYGDFDTMSSDGVTVANPAFNKVRRLAAGYAANILAYRDADDATYLNPVNAVAPVVPGDAVPLPEIDDIDDIAEIMETQYIGLEMQPFLVEAFLAHVYELEEADWDHEPGIFGEPQVHIGDRVLCSTLTPSTIVVVQISNPYDRPIALIEYNPATGDPVPGVGGNHASKFELSVFGQTLDLGHLAIQDPAPNLFAPGLNLYVLDPGEARTYFASGDPNDPDPPITQQDWTEILGLGEDDPDLLNPPPPDVNPWNTWVDLHTIPALAGVWSTDRDDYDDPAGENHAIELRRRTARYPGDPQPPVSVVVDRIDVRPGPNEPTDAGYRKFGERVVKFESLVNDPTFPSAATSRTTSGTRGSSSPTGTSTRGPAGRTTRPPAPLPPSGSPAPATIRTSRTSAGARRTCRPSTTTSTSRCKCSRRTATSSRSVSCSMCGCRPTSWRSSRWAWWRGITTTPSRRSPSSCAMIRTRIAGPTGCGRARSWVPRSRWGGSCSSMIRCTSFPPCRRGSGSSMRLSATARDSGSTSTSTASSTTATTRSGTPSRT